MNNPEEEGFIVIPRDYAKDANITQFSIKFPKQLQDKGIREQDFQHTITQLNDYFEEAESLSWTSIFEGCLGCCTLFLIFYCIPNQYERILVQVDKFIQEENETIYKPAGLLLLNPINNGLLELEFKKLN